LSAQISCEHVTIEYEGRPAVEDVSFFLEPGDYLTVIGENGSGKSTLIKGILGLLKLSSGRVVLNGLKRSEIGYMPQQTAVQKDFPASVREVVLSGCLNRRALSPYYSAEDKRRAEQSMERLGVAPLRRACYRELSGGQQQRVLLARALCAADKLLVLDEPAAGLDPVITAHLYELIDGLNRQGVTIIMVSHDIHGALQCGSKILHMASRVAFFGTREGYMETDICRRMMGVHTHA
jgi:zinc transport system ATP-binding protein